MGRDYALKVFVLIRSKLNLFTSAEKKVAEYILRSDPSETVKLTITELAERCKVSEATVIRFLKKLGYVSFQELKLSMALEYSPEKSAEIQQGEDIAIKKDDEVKTILNKILVGANRSLENTRSIISVSKLIKAANLIRSAERIEIFGVGASGAVANILQYKLVRSGYPAYYISDSHIQSMSASIMKPTGLVIGISQSGSTKDTVDVLAIAKERGASTIAITDHEFSPISRYSDVVLVTFSGENPVRMGAGKSIFAQLYVIEVLIAILYTMDYEKSMKAGERTAEAVAKKLY